jgi:hypothetical protein
VPRIRSSPGHRVLETTSSRTQFDFKLLDTEPYYFDSVCTSAAYGQLTTNTARALSLTLPFEPGEFSLYQRRWHLELILAYRNLKAVQSNSSLDPYHQDIWDVYGQKARPLGLASSTRVNGLLWPQPMTIYELCNKQVMAVQKTLNRLSSV